MPPIDILQCARRACVNGQYELWWTISRQDFYLWMLKKSGLQGLLVLIGQQVNGSAQFEVDLDRPVVLAVIEENSDPPVPIAFTEWNTYLAGKTPNWYEDYDICDGLYGASVINACIQRCDRITNTAIYNLINVLGNYRVTPRPVWKTPTTLVLEVMTRQRGPLGISCQVESPTFSSPAIGGQGAYDAVAVVDAAATYDPQAGIVYLSVVNRDMAEGASIRIDGLTRAGAAKLFRVSAEHALVLNTETDPDAITIEEEIWQEGTDILQAPPLSFSLAVIPIQVDPISR